MPFFRRAYLFVLLLRLWFAISPSYLHPDENFQGPEVIAGQIFSYPRLPIMADLWLADAALLRWLWIGNGNDGEIPPIAVFFALRLLMLTLSFVLEDWAIYELVESPKHRKVAVMLVASSYVTWTYQTHTFSNSIETLAVAWSLVLIQRIVAAKKHSSVLPCGILAFVVVFGIFNRITFPAFLFIPGLRLLPHFKKKVREEFVPTQVFLSKQLDATHAIWWKTYSPPIWLLNGKNEVLVTHDLMGMQAERMLEEVIKMATCLPKSGEEFTEATYLIAPTSATFLDKYTANQTDLYFEEMWRYRNHFNLDDVDFGDDGFLEYDHKDYWEEGNCSVESYGGLSGRREGCR
ncbi:hypothetical protein DID88_008296 [Monilinia fructigena]|uniref:Mannosyltransferase n=1 Tax=Monilinia fructigena TaxID=38457 RepID=A0A395J5B5_9HELO|nr:hypothetical protein DID88_008296 [Monilinia fructigena]